MADNKAFPDRVLPAEKKDKTYGKLWGDAIYSFYNGTGNKFINSDIVDKFKSYRRYAAGNQPEEMYKDLFALERDNKSPERKGINNLDFKIKSPAPRIVDTVIEILSDKNTRLDITFLDEISSEEKIMAKYQMQAAAETEEFTKQIDAARGVQTPSSNEFTPASKEELDIFEVNGGIRLPLEIALEQGLDYVFNYDVKWDNLIADTIYADLITLGIAGTVDYIDPKTNSIKVRTFDPENIVIDGSKHLDYSDAQFFGEIRPMTILDVYRSYKATTGKELTEDEIRKMAESGEAGAESYDYDEQTADWYTAPVSGDLAEFMPYRVKMLDFVYLSIDVVENLEREKTIKHYLDVSKVKDSEVKSGKIIFEDGKFYKNVKKKKKKIELEVWRRAKQIIGTDIIYDDGLCYDQIRDENMKPIKPFHVIRVRSNSIIDKIIPNLDALQINSLKIQNLKANIKGSNVAIEMESLANIKMGKADMGEKQILKLWDLGAPLFYKNTKAGNPYDKASGTPIQELRGGMGIAYNELRSDSQDQEQQIQLTTGLNEVALASNPNPEVTLGQSEMAMQGSKNAIMNIHKAFKLIKESVAFSVAIRLQNIAKKQKNHPLYRDIMGKSLWKALGNSSEKSIAKNEIKVMDSASKEEIQSLLESVNLSIQAGTLEAGDLLYAKSMILEGKSLKLISVILDNRSERRKAEAQAQAESNSQQNSQSQQDIQAQKLEAEAAQNAAEVEAKRVLQAEEFEQKRILQQEKYDLELRNQTANDKNEAALNGGEFSKDNNS